MHVGSVRISAHSTFSWRSLAFSSQVHTSLLLTFTHRMWRASLPTVFMNKETGHATHVTQASCWLLARPWPVRGSTPVHPRMSAEAREARHSSPHSGSALGGSTGQVSLEPQNQRCTKGPGVGSWVRTQMWKPAFGKVTREGLDGEFSWRTWRGTHHGQPALSRTMFPSLATRITLILSFKSYRIFSTGRKPARYTPWIQNQPTSSFSPSQVMPL